MNCIALTKKGKPCKFKKKIGDFCTRHSKTHSINAIIDDINKMDIDVDDTELNILENTFESFTLNPTQFQCFTCNRFFDKKNEIENKCLFCHATSDIDWNDIDMY
jgi:hypothetical protein